VTRPSRGLKLFVLVTSSCILSFEGQPRVALRTSPGRTETVEGSLDLASFDLVSGSSNSCCPDRFTAPSKSFLTAPRRVSSTGGTVAATSVERAHRIRGHDDDEWIGDSPAKVLHRACLVKKDEQTEFRGRQKFKKTTDSRASYRQGYYSAGEWREHALLCASAIDLLANGASSAEPCPFSTGLIPAASL
jgi:hypothetical protein